MALLCRFARAHEAFLFKNKEMKAKDVLDTENSRKH